MRIDWQPNPLFTKIILDDHDKEILKLKIRIQEIENNYALVCHYIKEGPRFNLDRARQKAVRLNKDELAKEVERVYGFLIEETEAPHCGDCTCVAMSCSKCALEDLLGINTVEGRNKYTLGPINDAFDHKNDGSITIDQAIQKLIDYVPYAEWEGWESCADRWKAQSDAAAVWLTAYRDKHFPQES